MEDRTSTSTMAVMKIDEYFSSINNYRTLPEAIARVERFMNDLHFTTPLYDYSLLNEDAGFHLALKLENLARLGDIAARGFLGVLAMSIPEGYSTPESSLEFPRGPYTPAITIVPKPGAAVTGLPGTGVLGVPSTSLTISTTTTSAEETFEIKPVAQAPVVTDICFAITPGSSFATNCQGLTCTARFAHLGTKIFVADSSLNLLTIYLLHNCKQMGAQVIVLDKGADADKAARDYCQSQSSVVYIDGSRDGEMALIGLMTCCSEVFASDGKSPAVVVIPEESQAFTGFPLAGAFGLYMSYYGLLDRCQLVTTQGAALPRQAALMNAIQPFVFNSVNSCRVDLVFDAWDVNHDGSLQLAEIASVYCDLCGKCGICSTCNSHGGCSDGVKFSHLPVSTVERMFGMEAGDTTVDSLVRLGGSLTVSGFTEIILNQISSNLTLYNAINADRVTKFSPTYLRTTGVICTEPFRVHRTDELRALKTALNVTHTYASGLSNHALAACLSYEHGEKLRRIVSSSIQRGGPDTVCAIIVGGLVDPLVFENEIAEALKVENQLVRFSGDFMQDGALQARMIETIGKCGLNTVKVSVDSFQQNTKLTMRITAYSPGIEATLKCREELEKFVMNFRFLDSTDSEIQRHCMVTANKICTKQVCCPKVCSTASSDTPNEVSETESGKVLAPFSVKPFSINSSSEITLEAVQNALDRIKRYDAVHETLIYRTNTYSRIVNQMYDYSTPETAASVYLMLENTQRTGSFKVRGSSNMIIKAYEYAKDPAHNMMPMNGVVACSAGNHAQGVALISQKLGIPCTIVCPETAPLTKLVNTKRYGAEVLPHGLTFDDSVGYARQLCTDRNWTFIPPFAAWEVIEGQATIALELLQKQPDLDTIVINVGGGGMIAGCAIVAKLWAAKRGKPIRVVGVQASVVHPLKNYKEKGMLTFVDPATQTLADGCNVKVPGGIHNEVLRNCIDEYICVEENEIAATIVHTLMRTRTLCEGAGCMGVTALLYGKLKVRPGEKVGVVMCGGNIDVTRICAISKYGLKALGRAVTIEIDVPDTVGQLSKICKITSRHNMVAENIMHLRESEGVQWDHCKLVLTLWCNSFDSINRVLIAILKETGFVPRIVDQNAVPNAKLLFRPFEEERRSFLSNKKRELERKREIFDSNEIKTILTQ